MHFRDREDAGKQLIPYLEQYRDHPNTLVIGLPRGGVVNAYEVAKGLNLPLDVVCPRKIGAPMNPELAIGAITETGEGVFHEQLITGLGVDQEYIDSVVEEEKIEAQKRLKLFRKGRPPLNVEGKTVIIVDDGLATGATMKAAIRSLRAQNPETIVVAVPVSPQDTLAEISAEADQVICIESPSFFHAVGQFYEQFSQTQDEEVVALLEKHYADSE